MTHPRDQSKRKSTENISKFTIGENPFRTLNSTSYFQFKTTTNTLKHVSIFHTCNLNLHNT